MRILKKRQENNFELQKKFRLFALIFALMSIIVSPLNVVAATANGMETESTSQHVYRDYDDNELIFPSKEDYEAYVEDITLFNSGPYGEEWRLKKTVTKELNHHKLGFHSGTPQWTYASSYTLGVGKSYNISASYTWKEVKLDLGFKYSFSVATAIPADSSKYSRLGVFADYTLVQTTYEQYKYNKPTGVVRTNTFVTKTAEYIEPVYK